MSTKKSRLSWLQMLLRPLSWLVPAETRASWRRQWQAELQHRATLEESGHELEQHAAGALVDAFWMRADALREGILFDIRLAWRGMVRRKAGSLLMVLVLAVGLGGSVLIAGLVDSVLLAPLPYPEPERIVRLWETNIEASLDRIPSAKGNLISFREAASLESLAGYYVAPRTVKVAEMAEVVTIAQVSEDFFAALGTEPLLGRTFSQEETALSVFNGANSHLGEDPLVVLSYGFWRSRFHGDHAILGRSFELESKRWTVIGVMPQGFGYPSTEVAAWIPWSFTTKRTRDQRYVQAVGRLAAGRGLEQAQQELTALSHELAEQFPDTNQGWGVDIEPLHQAVVGGVKDLLWVAFGAVGCVWLLATVNIAVLQLVRSGDRQQELTLRRALGASRLRLSRLVLLDAALPVAAGTVAALLSAYGVMRWLQSSSFLDLPRLDELTLGPRAWIFAIAVALVTAFLTGLGPALLGAKLRHERSGTPSRFSQRLRGALVIAEVALAMLLLTAAGLFTRSLLELYRVDPGFDSAGVLVAPVILDNHNYGGAESRAYYQRLLSHLEAVPGVVSVGASTVLPMSPIGPDFDRPVWGEGQAAPAGGHRRADMRMATPGLFRTLGIELRRGRDFGPQDQPDSPRVVIVNSALAEELWPGLDPVGRRLMVDLSGPGEPYEVVGQIADLRGRGPAEPPRREFYTPHAQRPYLIMNLAIRVEGPTAAFLPRIKQAILELDASQPAHSVSALADLVDGAVAKERATTLLVAILSAIALLLATLGVYGALAMWVRQRHKELGIRVALGADGAQVARWVLSFAGALIGVGLAAGGLMALGAGRAIEGLLYGIGPIDAVAFAAALGALLIAGAVATLLPLRRALATDPAQCLRSE